MRNLSDAWGVLFDAGGDLRENERTASPSLKRERPLEGGLGARQQCGCCERASGLNVFNSLGRPADVAEAIVFLAPE